MRDIIEVLHRADGKNLNKDSDFNWSIDDNGAEIPGLYESYGVGERAFKFGDGPLRRLQEEADKTTGIITDEMMSKLEQQITGG